MPGRRSGHRMFPNPSLLRCHPTPPPSPLSICHRNSEALDKARPVIFPIIVQQLTLLLPTGQLGHRLIDHWR